MIETGDIYLCVGKRQKLCFFWNLHIEIGDTLPEVTEPGLNVPDGTLLLRCSKDDALLVDKDQFKKVSVAWK